MIAEQSCPSKLCPVPFDWITRGQEPCTLLCSDANLNTVALSELSVSCGWIWMSLCSSISLFWLKLQSCSRRTSLGKEKRTGLLGPWWARAMTIILSFHNLCCPLVLSSQNGGSQRPCAYSSCTLFLKNSIRPGIHFANRKALITRRCKSH